MKKKAVMVISVVSLLMNILGIGYILKEDVYIVFKNHYYLGRRQAEEINYNEINREVSWVESEDMAVRLAEAYLGDWLNYREESNPVIHKAVSFDEDKYEYLVEITIKQDGIKTAPEEERYFVGIRKDYGIVTYYDL